MADQIRASGIVTLRQLQTIHKNGKVYHYLRVPREKRQRLPDLPINSPEFLASYSAALAAPISRSAAKSGTIALMIEGYLASATYKAQSESYRRTIRRHAEAVKGQAEDALAAHLTAEDIADDLEPLTPNAAADRLTGWRAICTYGKRKRFFTTEPLLSVRRKPIPKTIGYTAWTHAEIDQYRAKWRIGTVHRLCFKVVLWTGARISDAVMIAQGMISHVAFCSSLSRRPVSLRLCHGHAHCQAMQPGCSQTGN